MSIFLDTTMEFTNIQSNELGYYNNTDTYIFGDSTSTYGLAVSFEAGVNAKTPYTTNDLKKADDQVLTAAKFKVGRGGEINEKKYSDTLKK